MNTFATVDDLALRWRTISEIEKKRAETLLDDASMLICAEFRKAGAKLDSDDPIQVSACKIVACSIVKRVMLSDFEGDYSQETRTVGPFSSTVTFANPSGDMYLTKQERRILGLPSRISGVGFAHPV